MKKIKIIVLIGVAFASFTAMASTNFNRTNELLAQNAISQQNVVMLLQSNKTINNLIFHEGNNLKNKMTDGDFLDFVKKLIAKVQESMTTITTSSNSKTSQRGPRLSVGSCVSGCVDGL